MVSHHHRFDVVINTAKYTHAFCGVIFHHMCKESRFSNEKLHNMMRRICYFTLACFRKKCSNTHYFFWLSNVQFAERCFVHHKRCEWLCPCLPRKKSHEVTGWNIEVSSMKYLIQSTSVVCSDSGAHKHLHRVHDWMFKNVAFS